MKQITRYIAFIWISVSFASCYYDKAEIIYPGGGCDTTAAISYSRQLVPIFQQQCYSCHASAASGGGILMGNYTSDRTIAVNGRLYGSVSHASGYSPMPKGGGKMTACQLGLIRKWIAAGAPNN